MHHSSIRVTIGEREVTISRARLGLFLILERHLKELRDAVEHKDSGGVVHAIHAYLQRASGEQIELHGMDWFNLYQLFIDIRTLNALTREIPLLKRGGFSRIDTAPWDHEWRSYVLWVHIIASTYGWSKTEIEELWPEDAAVYVQEILTDEQLKKEWEHMLSPVAHPLNKQGKDQFRPLRRPAWMSAKPRKQRIARALLPVGTIIDLTGIKPEDLDD